MRIVIAAGIYPPDIGGPATYASRMSEQLHDDGHDVRVICYSDSGENGDQVPVVRVVRRRGIGAILTAFQYLLILHRESRRCDIIYAQGPTTGGMQALILSSIFGTSYVVKVTGDYAWEQNAARYTASIGIDEFQRNNTPLPMRIRLLRTIQRLVCKRAQHVIVPSRYLKDMVIGWGVVPSRITVIYNAIDIPVDKPALSEESNVLSIGRLVPWKGFRTLISIWPRVCHAFPNARLHIVGDGPDRSLLQNEINENHLENAITVHGVKKGTELESIFAFCSLFVLNSGYEGLSHVILEAMAHGMPCIVSNKGGNPELIVNDRTGLLFTYDDPEELVRCIVTILQDSSLRKKIGTEAYARASQYTTQRQYDETVAVMDRFRRTEQR